MQKEMITEVTVSVKARSLETQSTEQEISNGQKEE